MTAVKEAFITAISPTNLEMYLQNDYYYKSEEEYLLALADAMNQEYRAIVDSGFLLQIDDPTPDHPLQSGLPRSAWRNAENSLRCGSRS